MDSALKSLQALSYHVSVFEKSGKVLHLALRSLFCIKIQSYYVFTTLHATHCPNKSYTGVWEDIPAQLSDVRHLRMQNKIFAKKK